jgi:predicted transcriptional regulator
MKLLEVKEILNAEVITGQDKMDIEFAGGAAADLMSDLLRVPRGGALLLTGLNSIQVIRTSIISGMSAVVLVRDKKPEPEMIEQAKAHGLPLLSSPLNMFTSCGRLYKAGLRSIR